jgi:EAL domain-containing protein (putative c-di-GMP-specific phosphodiesterase class I)
MLKDISVDVIKLDKEFFSHDSMGKKDKIVASNIIKMAQELEIKVLSEGVETVEQADFLTEVGCDMAQGYLFAKPMTIESFEKILFK